MVPTSLFISVGYENAGECGSGGVWEKPKHGQWDGRTVEREKGGTMGPWDGGTVGGKRAEGRERRADTVGRCAPLRDGRTQFV